MRICSALAPSGCPREIFYDPHHRLMLRFCMMHGVYDFHGGDFRGTVWHVVLHRCFVPLPCWGQSSWFYPQARQPSVYLKLPRNAHKQQGTGPDQPTRLTWTPHMEVPLWLVTYYHGRHTINKAVPGLCSLGKWEVCKGPASCINLCMVVRDTAKMPTQACHFTPTVSAFLTIMAFSALIAHLSETPVVDTYDM